MPPFIDGDLLTPDAAFDANSCWPAADNEDTVRLVSPAMMRPGAKMDSYRILAEALRNIADINWSLVIAGGGPGTDEVTSLFEWAGERVNIIGERTTGEVISLMNEADVLTWPGCREAYGMVYLEAASFGVPAVALKNMGVPLVVEHQNTGLLADPPDVEHYAALLRQIITDPQLRSQLGANAQTFAHGERSGASAAQRLKTIIDPILEKHT